MENAVGLDQNWSGPAAFFSIWGAAEADIGKLSR